MYFHWPSHLPSSFKRSFPNRCERFIDWWFICLNQKWIGKSGLQINKLFWVLHILDLLALFSFCLYKAGTWEVNTEWFKRRFSRISRLSHIRTKVQSFMLVLGKKPFAAMNTSFVQIVWPDYSLIFLYLILHLCVSWRRRIKSCRQNIWF